MTPQQSMADLDPGFLFNLGTENNRSVVALLTGVTGRREWAERRDPRVAGGTVADKKDVVSGAEEQQVASPVGVELRKVSPAAK